MRHIAGDEIDAVLDFPALVDALCAAFGGGFFAPARHHHAIDRPGENAATHLLMPAWTLPALDAAAYIGTKLVNVFPDNNRRGLPTVFGLYALQSGVTGQTLATLDGTRLTHWRTAAASALAARFLARADATKLLIVGAGALAPYLARAHASVRPIDSIAVWNHRRAGAEKMAQGLGAYGFRAHVADDLAQAVGRADSVSCATLATAPLIAGNWLREGQHVDLVGAFNLAMREVDDAALRRARIFVDTPAALVEGGDVAIGLSSGAVDRADIVADLAALCAGAPGRRSAGEITLFKSVGASIEDLAAAILVWKKVAENERPPAATLASPALTPQLS
jgi:ornithine cyclodeaminase/alanine dehydrogenase-like protein (mu-crystallin family)